MDANALYAEAKELYKAGQLNDALSAFEQAHAAFVAQGDEANVATAANDLGVVYYLAGRYDDARKILQDALTAFEKLGDVPGQAKAIGNLARLMDRLGEKDSAEKNYQRAAELFHKVGEKGFETDTYRVRCAAFCKFRCGCSEYDNRRGVYVWGRLIKRPYERPY